MQVFKKLTLPWLIIIALPLFSYQLAAQQVKPVSLKTKALFDAIRSGSSAQLENQLTNGADPNDTLNSYSALMAATLNGSVEQMKILLDHGARVNDEARDSVTALWLAVPDWDKTMLLLDHGADPRHTIHGYGILVKLATIPGTIKLFQALVDHGADMKKSATDNYLVYNAASSGDTAVLGYILRNGFSANDSIFLGDYPLNNAELFLTFPTLKMLVDRGANPNVMQWIPPGLEAFKGFTPLMFAAVEHDKPSVLYLLEHGANPNAKSKLGYTPLMLLQQSEADDPELTLALINHGATVSDKTAEGRDALFFAQRTGNTQSAALLKKYTDK